MPKSIRDEILTEQQIARFPLHVPVIVVVTYGHVAGKGVFGLVPNIWTAGLNLT